MADKGIDFKKVKLRDLMFKSATAIGSFIAGGISAKHMPHLVKDALKALRTAAPDPLTKAFAWALTAAVGLGGAYVSEAYHLFNVAPTLLTEQFWIGTAGLSLHIVTGAGGAALTFGAIKELVSADVGSIMLIVGITTYVMCSEKLTKWFEDWRKRGLAAQSH